MKHMGQYFVFLPKELLGTMNKEEKIEMQFVPLLI